MNVYNLYLQRLAHSGDDVTKDQHQKLMEEMVTETLNRSAQQGNKKNDDKNGILSLSLYIYIYR